MSSYEEYRAETEEEKRYWHEYYEKIENAAKEWRLKWPNACPMCHGWGGATSYQGHPYGSTTAYEAIFDGDGCTHDKLETCHRCGQDGLNEDGEGPCTKCGWNFDDGDPG